MYILIPILTFFLSYPILAKTNEKIDQVQQTICEIQKNTTDSFKTYEILTGIKKGNKKKKAFEVEQNLGNHIPATIMAAAAYFISNGNLETAALLAQLALFRATVDVDAANDDTIGAIHSNLFTQLYIGLRSVVFEKKQTFIRHYGKAAQKVITLDKSTPRNYDTSWPLNHSLNAFSGQPLQYPSKEAYQKSVEKAYKAFLDNLSDIYADIETNLRNSYEAFDILMGKQNENKAKIALEVEQNLGSFTPPTIIAAAGHFASVGNFKTAALLTRFAMFRATVDVEVTKDPSLAELLKYLVTILRVASIRKDMSDKDLKNTGDFLWEYGGIRVQEIINLDKSTPRNYDTRWPCLYGLRRFLNAPLEYPDKVTYQKAIEHEYEKLIDEAKKYNTDLQNTKKP